MPLTIHHLHVSQSERLPWLSEELGIPYTLTLYTRSPLLSPPSLQALTPLGAAPVIQDTDKNLTLWESAACVEYIIHTYGNGKLALKPGEEGYAHYLYWFHFSNGTFQPLIVSLMQLSRFPPELAGDYAKALQGRFSRMLKLLDDRLKANEYLAGEEFTAADVMIVFSLTTMRAFYGYELVGYEGILAYLKRVTGREGYLNARAKADEGLELMIGGEKPRSFVERLKAAGKI
jgi:glutathione S-transferase